MKRSTGILTLIAVTGIVFFVAAFWRADAQRLIARGSQPISDTRKDISPELQARIIADREDETGPGTDLSAVPRAFLEAGTIIYAYENVNRHLISFDAASPGTLLTDVPLTGLGEDAIYGLDFRPADGILYGITTSGFPTPSRLVKINVSTGEVVRVHPTNTVPTIIDSFYGFDIDQVEDRVRNVGRESANRRLNPTTGQLAVIDTRLQYAAGDVNAGVVPRVVHVATAISTTTGLPITYGVDSQANTLVRIGGANGNPSANGGELTTIGSLGLDPTNFGSMDIQPGATSAYASLFINSIPTFVTIDLATGTASIIGRIGGLETEVVDCIAVQTGPIIVPTPVPTPTGAPTPTPGVTPTPGASPTPTATATPRTTPTPIPSVTPTPIPANASIIRAVSTLGVNGAPVTVPFELQARGGEQTIRFSFSFNPAVFSSPVVTSAQGGSFTTDLREVAEGRIGIVFESPSPYPAGARRFVNVTLNVNPATPPGTYPLSYVATPLAFEIRDGNGSVMPWWFEPGLVVNATTAAGVEVSGRVLTPDGRGLRNAAVSITGIDGIRRTVTTSSFGYYRFEDIEAGGTYVVSVGSKRYSFSPRALHVTDTLTDIDFIGN